VIVLSFWSLKTSDLIEYLEMSLAAKLGDLQSGHDPLHDQRQLGSLDESSAEHARLRR